MFIPVAQLRRRCAASWSATSARRGFSRRRRGPQPTRYGVCNLLRALHAAEAAPTLHFARELCFGCVALRRTSHLWAVVAPRRRRVVARFLCFSRSLFSGGVRRRTAARCRRRTAAIVSTVSCACLSVERGAWRRSRRFRLSPLVGWLGVRVMRGACERRRGCRRVFSPDHCASVASLLVECSAVGRTSRRGCCPRHSRAVLLGRCGGGHAAAWASLPCH